MEFKIANKAKTFTLALIVIGVLFTGIGIALNIGADNFGQRFMANGLINSFFFFSIGLGALFFLALAYATETGWYAAVKRIIEAVAGFIPYGIGAMLLILIALTLTDGGHIYTWMDSEVMDNDPLIKGKEFFLNKPFFWIRTIAYLGVYYIFWKGFRKRSLEEDRVGGTEIHFTNYKKGALFLVFFSVFSSTSSWDWLMAIDVHWFSTLFGWYTFAGVWCSSMVVLVILTLYLKKLGYLPKVNDSHIHDLGKWTFATSFLWSYLWFSQYMLIWYANIGEEVVYYMMRIENYKVLYFGMFIVNFAFPMLLLMSREAKRHAGILTLVGVIILCSHWVDVYIMVSAGSMGATASIGFMEIGMAVLMAGIFIRVILTNLTKAPLSPVNHPFLDESIHHEI
ncbi:MAG: quinol:cytochrome C oxidoreductase [Crocinitomicaceae bacterium]|nr:quinol:cytochrome C oxidoreductase [Crocinitomicaceae bacterium]